MTLPNVKVKQLNKTCQKGRRFGSCTLSNIKINIYT